MSRMKQTSVMRLPMFTHILCDLYSRNEIRWDHAEDVGRRRFGNCLSIQALDCGGGACCAQRGTIKALCWGTLKWQFHGRTKIRRFVQTEILLKTDLSLAKHRQPRLEVAEKYCQVADRSQGIKEWIQGYILITSCWYPLHFHEVREDRETTKVRIVYYSLTIYGGMSHNSMLWLHWALTMKRLKLDNSLGSPLARQASKCGLGANNRPELSCMKA